MKFSSSYITVEIDITFPIYFLIREIHKQESEKIKSHSLISLFSHKTLNWKKKYYIWNENALKNQKRFRLFHRIHFLFSSTTFVSGGAKSISHSTGPIFFCDLKKWYCPRNIEKWLAWEKITFPPKISFCFHIFQSDRPTHIFSLSPPNN